LALGVPAHPASASKPATTMVLMSSSFRNAYQRGGLNGYT
jgi:hypothetical protein